jgi:hypothetical protein
VNLQLASIYNPVKGIAIVAPMSKVAETAEAARRRIFTQDGPRADEDAR